MSAIVCVYVIGITALVAVAAAAIEWAVQGRTPTRHLWTAAMVCALLLPPLAILQHARGLQRPVVSPTQTVLVDVVQFGHVAGAALGSRERGSPMHTLRDEYHAVVDRVSRLRARTILELWMVASLALVAWIVYGAMHWHRERGAWEATELDGVPVHLSAETGPAVLGVMSQRIVLPAWVRTLAPEYRELMLAHECEHIAARDPQRLALALGALVLMPWNPALWWCAARMRRAIELDCDARVLRRHPSPREYGYLLLQVAARGNNVGPLAVPLVNLLRLPSELELRLRAMTRPRTIAGRTALAGAACAIAAASVAFTTPVPAATRPTIRNLVQAARARVARDESAVTHAGRIVIQRDSATRPRDESRMTERLRVLRVAQGTGVRDTVLRAVVADSIQNLASRLRAVARGLGAGRASADSANAQMKLLLASAEALDTAAARARAQSDSAREARRARLIRANQFIDRAVPGLYSPHAVANARTSSYLWLLADRSGTVLQHKWVDAGALQGAGRLQGVNPRDLDLIVERPRSAQGMPIGVTWLQLK